MCNQLSMGTYYLKIIGTTVSIAQSCLMFAVNFYPCFCAGTEQNPEEVKHHQVCKPDIHGNIRLIFSTLKKKNFSWRIIALWWCVSFCHCCCSVTKLCPTLYDLTLYSLFTTLSCVPLFTTSLFTTLSCVPLFTDLFTTDFPILYYLPEFAQIHGPLSRSHPLSSPSLPALNLSQHQGLFE